MSCFATLSNLIQFIRRLLPCVLLCLISDHLNAQPEPAAVYTIKDGLPSNVIYQSLEDQKGYLWLATDQGVVRYDGKKFQVYAKTEGVPDIEVMRLIMDNDGRIWIRCYNNSVAFYDSSRDRFVEITSILNQLNIKKVQQIHSLKEGGIQLKTEAASFIIDNRIAFDLTLFKTPDSTHLLYGHPNGLVFTYSSPLGLRQDAMIEIRCLKGSRQISSTKIPVSGRGKYFLELEGQLNIFEIGSRSFTRVEGFNANLNSLSVSTHRLGHPYYQHQISDKYLIIFDRIKDIKTGKDVVKADVYDRVTLRLLFRLDENYIAFHLLNDRQGKLWLSTLENGLILYNKPVLVNQLLTSKFNEIIFYSVTGDKTGGIYAGNEKGEVVYVTNKIEQVNKVKSANSTDWVRNIDLTNSKVFTFSDGGIFVNYQREITPANLEHIESKVVYPLNDSIILSGSNSGLFKIHTRNESAEKSRAKNMVITAISSNAYGDVFVGSTEGLWSYDQRSDQMVSLSADEPLFRERIVGLTCTEDGLLWIATATNGMLVVRQNKLLAHLREIDGMASNNLSAMVKGEPGQIWVGHTAGISRINYELKDHRPEFTISNLSAIDGLSSNRVNQLYFEDGRLYAATERGVNWLKDSIVYPEIKVELTKVQVNQQDTVIALDYKLKANQRNIALHFSGVELSGYFDHVEYSLDKGETWTALPGSILRYEFESGEHLIQIRAVDVNKNVHPSTLEVRIDIETPYWKTWWFWVLMMVFVQAGLAYLFYKRQQAKDREKKKVELAKAHLASLEQQAFTSLMNPHFMFNALNSIQHYINNQDRQNANRYLSDFASLIRKNFEAAQIAFIPLEQEIENVSLYMRLEKMRFNDKFTFEVIYEAEMDPEEWMMPTMILQPLVENSILHGIMPSSIPGKLFLKLSCDTNELTVEVIDNGIGVENSRAMKQGSKHRSRGMELIYKRLHALSFFCRKELQLEYSVPYDDERNPGNRTSLSIPFDLYTSWKEAQRTMSNQQEI